MPATRFELLATWYLRFNGYYTTPDFTIHPDFRKQPGGTDADVLAVRFPHSAEYQRRFDFQRDLDLIRPDRIDFLICEVKAGRCDINQNSWRDPRRENVEYVIRWMGFESDNTRIQQLAETVYRRGACDLPDNRICVRFVCFGAEPNPELKSELPEIHEILHKRVIGYLRERFCTGCHQITRENWDKDIIEFADVCRNRSDQELLEWARQGNSQQPAQPAAESRALLALSSGLAVALGRCEMVVGDSAKWGNRSSAGRALANLHLGECRRPSGE